MFLRQKTISKKLSFSGIGLHSGEKVKITLSPRKEDTGISFIFKNEIIDATWKNGNVSQLCTKLKKNNIYISTIEHLMSSLSGLGISNLLIDTSATEMPILDGSAKDFVKKILETGIQEQNKLQKILKIKKKISLKKENKFIEIYPHDEKHLTIDYTIDYKDEFIKKQNFVYKHNFKNYQEIFEARTFCLHEDLEKIFSLGLAKGGSLDNAIVVSGKKILNQGGLRYKNEFVKHKILDCVGDLYLANYQIWGKVKVYSGGHELNLEILREIYNDKNNYEILTIGKESLDINSNNLKLVNL